MLFDILDEVPHAFTGVVPGTFIVDIAKSPLNRIGIRAIGWQIQHCEARMGGQPLLDFGGLVDLGVVGDDGEVSKERRRVGAIKRLQQVKEKPGLLTLPHTRGEGAGSRASAPAR